MLVRSKIQEAKGLSAQIARLFLWSDKHLIVEEKSVTKTQQSIIIRDFLIYMLLSIILILSTRILKQQISIENQENHDKTRILLMKDSNKEIKILKAEIKNLIAKLVEEIKEIKEIKKQSKILV